jgi:two-component system NtrC family sensor kinase
MWERVLRALGAEQFMPHGHCYLWGRDIVALHVVSDALIFLSYVTIPITLVYFMRRRKDLPFSWMFALFGVFIVACGTTHAMEILTLWEPLYWLSGGVKVVTAVASVGTAILLARLVPQALAIPSPALLREALAEKDVLLKEIDHTQRVLTTMARRAGMADAATSILHNVGNALNTVNVTTDEIATILRGSKVGKLREAVAMLAEQRDPGRFLSTDPRGRVLVEYLGTVAASLEEDEERAAEALAVVAKNVEHVKVIVSLQQAHAKAGGIVERFNVSAVVEDALRFNYASYEEHEMRVVRELQASLEVQADRHKLLQIVTNLLSNARHAVREKVGDRRIVVRSATHDVGEVSIEVEDNGCGIPPENLDKIFTPHFTTKPNGNGYGLHWSACAAVEMGGALSARSDGKGQGATFTLRFPRQPRPAEQEADAAEPAPS